MPQIDSVVEDIYATVLKGIPKDQIPEDLVKQFGENLSKTIRDALVPREGGDKLRMSNIGKPCSRQLWYEVNDPVEEKFTPDTLIKFLIGHLCEELLIFLAQVAGHKVEGRQDTVEVAGIQGHRDLVLDGVQTDAKSASKYSFEKFKSGKLSDDDAFGYIPQLQGYAEGSKDDPLVTDKDRVAFLVIAKEFGKICLDVHPIVDWSIPEYFEHRKKIVARPEPPERAFEPELDGKSGNMKLGVSCSYCPAKHKCYPELRTFLYSTGPRFLTKVVREPDVLEVKNVEVEVVGD